MTLSANLSASKAPAPAMVDGRHLRSKESRRRIVDALLELVQEGDLEPRAESVAERAGVGLRSVFRHFRDMESLRREMSMIVEEQLRATITRPLAGATWREKLADLIERRADVFERVMPFRRAGNLQSYHSRVIQENSVKLNRNLRTILTGLLPENVLKDSARIDALDLGLCLESWIRMRIDQGLSPAKTKQVMILMANALLPDK